MARPVPISKPALPAEPEPVRERERKADLADIFPLRRQRSAREILFIAAGVLIVGGGLWWMGFQLWPHGSVEQSIVRSIEALPHFTERTGAENPFAAIVLEGDSSPAFVDFDQDGLPDLVAGSRTGEVHVFRNTGVRSRARFTVEAKDARGLVPTDTSNTVAFADLRGTQVPDALNAGTNGSPTFFANHGTPKRPEFILISPEDDPFSATAAPAQSFDWRPVFADIDHDGDADLFVGTRDGTILFFENRGTPKKPEFRGVTQVSPFGLRGAGQLVSLSFGDLDGDGDLDAVVGNARGELRYFENRGNAWRPKFVLTPPGTLGLPTAGPDATVALADLDGDGDLDCVVGGADGHLRYFENLSTPVAAH